MSCDTAKNIESVVDSSVTEGKHDNSGNTEAPEGLSDNVNQDAYPSGVDQARCCGHVGTSGATRTDKLYDTRYFIIKSLNYQNIQLSIEKGIWATQVMNEPILEEAYNNSGKVILIFSVNMSGFFQGYAQMLSSIGWRRDHLWSQGGNGGIPWGCSFKVKWLRLHDLPFQKTLHLKNPLNQYKPVKISRDCQELPQDIGEALCDLLDGNDDVDDFVKRDDASLDVLLSKRPSLEPSYSLQGNDCNASLMHITLARAPMLYPSLLYQHQADASRFNFVHQGPNASLPRNPPVTSEASKRRRPRNSGTDGSYSNAHLDLDSPRFDVCRVSAERSTPASSLTDDDILEMTYEEYLESYSRSDKLYQPAGGSSCRIKDSNRKEHSDDTYSSCRSSKRTCR